MKSEVEKQVAALLGPKTEQDVAAAAAPKKKVSCHLLPSVTSKISISFGVLTCRQRLPCIHMQRHEPSGQSGHYLPHCTTSQVKAPKPAAPKATAQANGAAAPAAPDEEAWRAADPFAFLPRPAANNVVHTSVHFRSALDATLRYSYCSCPYCSCNLAGNPH